MQHQRALHSERGGGGEGVMTFTPQTGRLDCQNGKIQNQYKTNTTAKTAKYKSNPKQTQVWRCPKVLNFSHSLGEAAEL
jgi:hypothetical protein